MCVIEGNSYCGCPSRDKIRAMFSSASLKDSLRKPLLELAVPPAGQIAFLDFLRSMAILLVVNGHASVEFVKQHGANWYSRLFFVANGWIGVDLFFVLSGFFIGSQLWSELRKTKKIAIGRFILRRGLRIWPLYFAVFAFIFIVQGQHHGWPDVAFVSNYVQGGIVRGGWSLSTEEQFYLIAPVVLLVLGSRIASWKVLRGILASGLLIVPALRALAVRNGASFDFRYHSFHTHCDGLIIGLLISSLWIEKNKNRETRISPWFIFAAGTVSLVVLRRLNHEVLLYSGLALFFGSLCWLGLHKDVPLFKSRLFYWVSRLSFGMYLNHFLLQDWVATLRLPSGTIGNVTAFLVLATSSALVSVVTFCLIEHPFLELRSRWMKKTAVSSVARIAHA